MRLDVYIWYFQVWNRELSSTWYQPITTKPPQSNPEILEFLSLSSDVTLFAPLPSGR